LGQHVTRFRALLEALDGWIDGYNTNYLYSTFSYRSPAAFEAEHLSQETRSAAAC